MKNIVILLLLFATGSLFGQEYSGEFVNIDDTTNKHYKRFILPLTNVRHIESSECVNIPKTTLNYKIYRVVINAHQYIYEQYVDKKISRSQFDSYIKNEKIDTTLLYREKINGNHFYVYVGVDTVKNEKRIVVDANNNRDFSDDEVHIIQLNGYWASEPSKYKFIHKSAYFDGEQLQPADIEVYVNEDPKAYSKAQYNDTLDYFLSLRLSYQSPLDCLVTMDNKDTIIVNAVNYNDFSYFADNAMLMFYSSKYDKEVRHCLVGDTIALGNNLIYIKQLYRNKLTLEYVKSLKDSSQVGNIIAELHSKSLSDNTVIRLNDIMRDKYVFLDFWGSWCGKCIEAFPVIKEMYDKLKSREDVVVIGIALDRQEDVPKLQDIIAANGIEWLNTWNEWDKQKSITTPQGRLSIYRYPTYIIIDKTGKIVFNNHNVTDNVSYRVEDAVDFFINLIK